MSYIGEIGKRLKITASYKKSFEYTDYKFSYYGTVHFIHTFTDADGNIIVWKSTNCVEWVKDGYYEFIPEGSVVELTGTVKDHSDYKGIEQTVFTRCRFKLLEKVKSKEDIMAEKAAEQLASLSGKDFIWTMPYKQYKEHYADCETVSGSYDNHEDSRGIRHSAATIDVIIREGRLKASGVRGKHFYGFEFTAEDEKRVCYRAVSEENARKQMAKMFPNSEGWKCTKVYNHR